MASLMEMPRLRGRVCRPMPGQGIDDKFCYEITVWEISGERKLLDKGFVYGPFENEKEAETEGLKKIREMCEFLEKAFTGGVSGKVFDFKNGGVLRPWENHS